MSGKTKLTLALLAATAMFTFNPNLVAHLLHVDANVSAEELPLDQGALNGLNVLASTATALDNKADAGSDGLLAPKRDFSDLAPAANDTATVKKDVAPGENPFAASKPTRVNVDPKADTVTNPGSFAIENAGRKPVDAAAVNPFADPAAKAKPDMPVADNGGKTKVKVDDGALRYYAANKDLKRLGAEMRRLKMLYPDWQPPKDLFSPVADVNEQPLWDIYQTGNYASVRAKIAQMQSSNPKWQPSDDLMLKLQMGETRSLIYRAYAQHRWQEVISTAQADPAILVCSDMQVLWNVGESFAQMKNYAQSFELYKYILTSCDDPAMRLATVQKASLVLPSQGMTSLISFGRIAADGTSEFENIGFDGIRRQVGEFIQHGDLSSAPSDEDLKRFVDFIQRSHSAADAGLIGWFFYAQEDWQMSNSWFIQAAQYDRSAKNLEGVIMTLRNMDRSEDALKIARRYLRASPEIARQYVEIVSESLTSEKATVTLKDKQFDDFEKIVADLKSPLGAQALGWKYLNGGDKDKAKDWFTQSVHWQPTEGGVVGLAVMAARDKDYKVLTSLKTQYSKEYASLGDFKIYTAKKIYRSKKYNKVSFHQVKKQVPKKKKGYEFQAPGL
jgi:tetratricopeptide (TPR) repeat protein